MKTIISFLFLSFLMLSNSPIMAQDISIRGKVIEAETSDPLEFANIALLSVSDSSLITGAMSELNGSFTFTTSAGDYILRLYMICSG